MDVVGIVKGLGTSPYHSKCCTYIGRPKKWIENKNNKKIPNSKNLAYYLGNQKFDNYVALKNQLITKSESTAVGIVTLQVQKYLPA